MYCYRITKYNPLFRDDLGSYQKNEWTSYSDVDKTFDNQILSYTEYLQVENAYINAIELFIEFLNVDSFTIIGLEKNDVPQKSNEPFSSEMLKVYSVIKNNKFFDKTTIPTIARLCLRNNIWCRLESDKMFIHFGYDYYMYIGSKNEPNNLILEKIKKSGLFVEQLKSSPHSPQE